MTAFESQVTVAGQAMDLYANRPQDGSGPLAAVVVIQHAPGVDEFTRAMTDRLAEAGYHAVAPDLYHRQSEPGGPLERMGRLKDKEVIADVNATVDALRDESGVDGERIGIVGFCMGGRVTYMMAAVNPHLKAAVAFYGGNIMKPWGEDVPAPFDRTADIACPLLFHFGADDTNPSPEDRRRLDEALSRAGKSHEFHEYAGAGHAFMNFTSEERYRPDAELAAWPRTLEFLERHLGGA